MPDVSPYTQVGLIATMAGVILLLAKVAWELVQKQRARADSDWRPEAIRLSKNLHEVRDIAQTAILRTAIVESKMTDVVARLDRIEVKLDRVLER